MIKNRTIFTGDNLDILRGMDSESIDLIYLDPPFNSNKHYAAPIGSQAAGAEFKDAWTFEDTDAAWWGELADNHESLYRVIDAAGAVGGKGDKAYLIYMAMRLIEMRRILKSTGSLYLHCDPSMSHSLKMTLDAIFGKKQFMSEIVWSYSWGSRTDKRWNKKHDIVLCYTKTRNYTFNAEEVLEERKLTQSTLNRLKYKGAMIVDGNKGRGKEKLALPSDVWYIATINGMAKERVGYPTQKPRALLERIIKASCPQDGIVLDPFCGCATTCIASEMLGRDWIGIDISPKAAELVKVRAENEIGALFPIIHRKDIPARDAPPRSKNVKHTMFGNQEGLCNGCKVQFPYSNFTIDHVIPIAKGGADTNGNLQLLCNFCNSVKGDRPMEYLLAKLNEN